MELIKAKVDINAQDNNGDTALHIACLFRHKQLAFKLFNAGANPMIKDIDGRTASDLAS